MVSSIFTAFLLGYAVSVVAGGRLFDRFRPEPLLVGSALLIVSGLCLCSVGSSLNQFLLLLFIVGLGSGATWAVPNTIVQRRFHGKPHAGLALGVVISGVGVGGPRLCAPDRFPDTAPRPADDLSKHAVAGATMEALTCCLS